MQAACADVIDGLVDLLGDPGNLVDGLLGEVQVDRLRLEQSLLLPDHIVLGLRQDPVEVLGPAIEQLSAVARKQLQDSAECKTQGLT